VDMSAFSRRAVTMSRADLASVQNKPGAVFFDRGLVDAAVALQLACNVPLEETLGPERPYNETVFLAPPWPEIYVTDDARRHDLTAARDEYERLRAALLKMSYRTLILPKAPIGDRADFVLGAIS